jgi:DNA-binding CsgD family transcriptional regulator
VHGRTHLVGRARVRGVEDRVGKLLKTIARRGESAASPSSSSLHATHENNSASDKHHRDSPPNTSGSCQFCCWPARLGLRAVHAWRWLRARHSARTRQRRRAVAREQLRTARQMFEAMGMDAFAERTRRELRATGETTQRRTVAVRHTELTIQEAQIARLARDGLTNPEIGTRLLISPHTIQYHLRKVFAKLGISSRSQLDRATLEFPTTGP